MFISKLFHNSIFIFYFELSSYVKKKCDTSKLLQQYLAALRQRRISNGGKYNIVDVNMSTSVTRHKSRHQNEV